MLGMIKLKEFSVARSMEIHLISICSVTITYFLVFIGVDGKYSGLVVESQTLEYIWDRLVCIIENVLIILYR